MRKISRKLRCLALIACHLFWVGTTFSADLRIGIIGCDTSHAVAFTELLNDPLAPGHVAGGKVVAAFKGGSPDIPSSATRVDGYAKTLKEKYGVVFCDTIEDMCRRVDVVLLESVDGRPHLEQARPVIKAGKPLFIDKPMAGSLRDAQAIVRLAQENNVPFFSSSALRFAKDTQAVKAGALGKVTHVEAQGPCELEPHHPDLFWYGIHGVEVLFTILGPECETVQRKTTPQGKIEVEGTWSGGRTGIFREDKDFHGLAKGEKGESPAGSFDGYGALVKEIVKFFQTREPPVRPSETLAILAFMEAADQSKRQGGTPVQIRDLLK
jgi:hypothetical protein